MWEEGEYYVFYTDEFIKAYVVLSDGNGGWMSANVRQNGFIVYQWMEYSRASGLWWDWSENSTPTARPTNTPTATPVATPTNEPKKTCAVTFDANGGTIATDVKMVTHGQNYGALPAAVKKGYNFVGWYTDSVYGTKVTEDTTVSLQENHTLYAHWSIEYKNIHLESLSYNFGNTRTSFQYDSEYKIPLETYEAVFGNTTKAYQYFINSRKWGGSCFGMVATSILFNTLSNDVDITDYNQNASSVYDCVPKNTERDTGISLTQFIEMMHVAQKDSRVQEKIFKNQNDLKGLCQAVKDTMEQQGYPVIIALYGPEGGHAVVGYKIDGNKLYIYDPNMPNVFRFITLQTNSKGEYVSWSYLINDTYQWESGKSQCWMSYVPYETVYQVWSGRGTAEESEQNLMRLDTDNAKVYDSQHNLVAEYANGYLQTTSDQVYEQVEMNLNEGEADGTHSFYLPAGAYTVKNTDQEQKEFTINMVNVNLSATVKTTADKVEMAVDDANSKNNVIVELKEGQSYEVSLDSSFDYDNKNITVYGMGQGDNICVSQAKGDVNIFNCVDAKIYINGEEVSYATIKAFANPGGTIEKEGLISVTKGTSRTFTIQPEEGYEIADVLVDGESKGAITSYQFENIQENHTIIASFKKEQAITPSPTTKPESESKIKKGMLVTVGSLQYKVTKVSDTNGTVMLVKSLKKARETVSIPDKIAVGSKKYKVTAIKDNVFQSHKRLKSVTIGKNVATIGKKVFYGDRKLKTVTIKSKVLKTIGTKAFFGIYKKAVVKIPKTKWKSYKKMLEKKGLSKNAVYKKI